EFGLCDAGGIVVSRFVHGTPGTDETHRGRYLSKVVRSLDPALLFDADPPSRRNSPLSNGELGGSGLGTTLQFQDLTQIRPVELADVLDRRQRRSVDYEVCAQITCTRKVSVVVPLSLNISTPQPM